MKRFFLFAYFTGLIILVHAQGPAGNSITGTLKDSASKMPLDYATVTLFINGVTKPFTGTTTDKAGSFTLAEIPLGTYNITFECLGYFPYTMHNVAIAKEGCYH